MKVLAVVGISGVGKTTLLLGLAAKFPMLHLQASQLIKSEQENIGEKPSTSDQLRAGPVLNNQALLTRGFEHAVTEYEGLVVFDGHVVIDTEHGLVEIPSSVLASLQCDHIAVLADDPTELLRRRDEDPGRQRPSRSVEQLRDQQERIWDVANRIASDLGIPCTVHSVKNVSSLENLILQLLHS